MSTKTRRWIELGIVKRVIDDLLAAGFGLWINHDADFEEERIDIKDSSEAAMAEMFACDEVVLVTTFNGANMGWVKFIYGNSGWDVISDYTTNLETPLKGANKLADHYPDERGE